jgi:hypothetical protein
MHFCIAEKDRVLNPETLYSVEKKHLWAALGFQQKTINL